MNHPSKTSITTSNATPLVPNSSGLREIPWIRMDFTDKVTTTSQFLELEHIYYTSFFSFRCNVDGIRTGSKKTGIACFSLST